MVDVSHSIDSRAVMTYAFRFASSDQLLHLTQQQIDLIPDSSLLVADKNENGEYVLNEPIEYSSLMAILHSLSCQNPCRLLNELPEDKNVLDTLQLYDYLSLPSFLLPFLRDAILVRSQPDEKENEEYRIEYHKANLSETRQTAAEFVMAFANNEYQL